MIFERIANWSDAYANGPNIPGDAAWPGVWAAAAAAFRDRWRHGTQLGLAYGAGARQRLDLFLPEGPVQGLMVYVHGGYWMKLDPSFGSHLAEGALGRGWAVAMPGYTLCPEVRIAEITAEIGQAITHAAGLVAGPISLTGHSAGGHLVSRMVSATSPLREEVAARLAVTVSISGLHDLRPLMETDLNAMLRLDADEAARESPALLRPRPGLRFAAWVGGNERAEFLRQSELLANVWRGLGAATALHIEPDRHHFNVVDGLADPGHPLTRVLTGG